MAHPAEDGGLRRWLEDVRFRLTRERATKAFGRGSRRLVEQVKFHCDRPAGIAKGRRDVSPPAFVRDPEYGEGYSAGISAWIASRSTPWERRYSLATT
jgi:hypothetical protein